MQDSDAEAVLDDDEMTAVSSEFTSQLSEMAVGRRVRVESVGGHRFEGTLESVRLADRHVLLRDVEEIPGNARAPSAFVAGVDWIVPVDDTAEEERS